jgi:hypothetical protein
MTVANIIVRVVALSLRCSRSFYCGAGHPDAVRLYATKAARRAREIERIRRFACRWEQSAVFIRGVNRGRGMVLAGGGIATIGAVAGPSGEILREGNRFEEQRPWRRQIRLFRPCCHSLEPDRRPPSTSTRSPTVKPRSCRAAHCHDRGASIILKCSGHKFHLKTCHAVV